MEHRPVLLNEVVNIFEPIKNGIFLDATVGGGGHSAAIFAPQLKVKSKKLKFIGIDQDYSALEIAAETLKELADAAIFIHGNFRNIKAILKELKVDKVNGILADLGMSGRQLDDPKRGFSFKYAAPLDMRMSTNSKSKTLNSKQNQNSKFEYNNFNEPSTVNGEQKLSAELIIKTWDEKSIADLLWKYGDERFSRKIARAIKENRRQLNFAKDLAVLCEKCIPPRYRKRGIHPATKTFQALRIAVNDEINALKDFLRDAPELLATGGRLAIISFHSLEDRLVKQRFNQLRTMNPVSPMPTGRHRRGRYELLTKKPIIATDDEVYSNPRSRSAKLRAMERV